MNLRYDPKQSAVIDESTGWTLRPRGWYDDGGSSFGFFDPNSTATSRGDNRWFQFTSQFIFEAPRADGKRPRPIGYRVNHSDMKMGLVNYIKGDADKLRKVELFVEAALKFRMTTLDGLADPVVEFG